MKGGALQTAMEGRLGHALVRARRRLRNVRQGPDRLACGCRAGICRILGGAPPESFTYELFLDEDGQKISKSKGNGLSVDEWLRYAPAGIACRQFMYNQPQRAKRLYFDVIPRAVDEYIANIDKSRTQPDASSRPIPSGISISAGCRIMPAARSHSPCC